MAPETASDSDRLRAIIEVLDSPSESGEGLCSCENCTETIKEASSLACENCGAVGRWLALECACYDYHCAGGKYAGAGCCHGGLTCIVCAEGTMEGGWERIKKIREALSLVKE